MSQHQQHTLLTPPIVFLTWWDPRGWQRWAGSSGGAACCCESKLPHLPVVARLSQNGWEKARAEPESPPRACQHFYHNADLTSDSGQRQAALFGKKWTNVFYVLIIILREAALLNLLDVLVEFTCKNSTVTREKDYKIYMYRQEFSLLNWSWVTQLEKRNLRMILLIKIHGWLSFCSPSGMVCLSLVVDWDFDRWPLHRSNLSY